MIDEITKNILSLKALPPDERLVAINEIMSAIKEVHPIPDPVSAVKWIPAETVEANAYNPNNVAPPEMRLLYLSIKEDGYTQPIVTYWDEEKRKYVIVDGFHRHRVGREYKDIREKHFHCLPIVEIEKSLAERMASTIRHNRARGKHTVLGMTDLVAELAQMGCGDDEIGKQLGMDADEVLRLKQTSGIAELFKGREYSRSWVQCDEKRE